MFESLSATQREIVFNRSGKFVVRACPGSGKTYCVSARLARLVGEWKEDYTGIAAVSFTNVAWKEIEKKYREEFSFKHAISFPHFIGTLDSFINQFIFLPFGHLVMQCNKRPILVGEPHNSWYYNSNRADYSKYFDKCSFDINDNLIKIAPITDVKWKKKDGALSKNVENILNQKKALVAKGYANQSDANYFAMKILEQFPSICQAIALRFPTLIVDEAQDTSEVQMRIIDLLAASGLNEIMLVGDPDQAIFEWNGARPALLNEKIVQWGNPVSLNENRRSSKLICKCTFNLSSLPAASTSVNADVVNWEFQPTVVVFNNNIQQVVTDFLAICTANGIALSAKTISILYRGKGMINEIVGVQRIPSGVNHWNSDNKFTKDFVRGKYHYDKGDFKIGFKLIEKAIIKMKKNIVVCSEDMIEKRIETIGFIQHRTVVSNYINILPNTNTTLGIWIAAANAAFASKNIQYILQINPDSNNFSFSQIFLNEDDIVTETNYRIGTVHSVKGETFDATLIILKERAANNSKYVNLLAVTNPPSDHEELRIVYVGMTRPRKVLMLAVPNEESRIAWTNKLNANN
ncbi:MAG: ATP-dependent helicase [Ignavibacteria bacterium]|nr:ATP-dependent helicase [Ignavibacteria bacterium]